MSRMANRQLAILRILECGRKVTIREICEKTESSKSTILRDLLDLSVDYPIETETGKYGGVRMTPVAKVGRQYLTRDELDYIAGAVSAVSFGSEKIRDSILQKIRPQGEEGIGESKYSRK